MLSPWVPRNHPVLILPGAVDLARFAPQDSRQAVRQAARIPDEALLLGMVARFQQGRGHKEVLDAVAEVALLHLALIGRGECEGGVRAHAVGLGMAHRVHFLGYQREDLPRTLCALDGVLLLREGNDATGRALLEAMACAAPVLAPSRPGWDATLEEAFSLRINPARLRESLQAFAAMPEGERRARGIKGRAALVAHDFTWEHRARTLTRFYEELCARAP